MRAIVFCVLLLLYAACAQAALFYQPGFRTLGMWSEEPDIRLDVSIWYPALRNPKELNYPPWVINGAFNARPADGKFPLLILSHDTPTDRFAHHNLAAWLAQAGFVVAAPSHSRDYMGNMDDLFTFGQLCRRVEEIGKTIDMVLDQKDLDAVVDKDRIGLIGFGSGGASALLAGGALPDCGGWPEYCGRAGGQDAYCSPWARDRMSILCQSFPLKASLADRRVKAVAAISPGYGMLFDSKSFRYFHPPLLLVCAGKDQFNAAKLHCEPMARMLGERARYLVLPDADAGALMATCPPGLAAELPELCQSVAPQRREAIDRELREALLAFFAHYLQISGSLPAIPPPPDLVPEQEEASKSEAKRR